VVRFFERWYGAKAPPLKGRATGRPLRDASTVKRLLLLLPFYCLWGPAAPRPLWPAAQLVINHPAPTVTSFSPSSAVAGSPAITLTIIGNNFVDEAVVTFGGQPLKPRDLSGSQITVSIPSAALVQVGSRLVSVSNPPPGGGTASALMPFQVTAPPTPPSQQP
jgi:IPT/TIG domain